MRSSKAGVFLLTKAFSNLGWIKRQSTAWMLGCLVLCAGNALLASAMPGPSTPAPPPAQTLYSFSLVKPGGQVVPLSAYKGKVVVIVNLASKSSFADQVPALEKLQEKYKDQGLVVIGVPSNDFGAEEPGDDAEIQKFYTGEHVQFPVMAKSAVSGKDALPVYGFLTAGDRPAKGKAPAPPNEVHWSFTKFIVTRDGQVGARFGPDVAPDSPEFEIAIDKALAGKLKLGAKPAPGTGGSDDEGDDDGGL
jgi:glutathione peroxidase